MEEDASSNVKEVKREGVVDRICPTAKDGKTYFVLDYRVQGQRKLVWRPTISPALYGLTATTTPVGFITVTIPAATNSTTPSNTTPSNTALSIPLYATASRTSAAASVDAATQFTLTGAAWTANQFVIAPTGTATTPYIAKMASGNSVGQFWLIDGNTTSQRTPPPLPGACPRSRRFRCGGRKSKFLAGQK
jgi:hypothetical protein